MGRKPRLKVPKTLAEIEERSALLARELAGIDTTERDRIGRLAVSAGLSELALSDDELAAGFRDLAASFRVARGPSRRHRIRQQLLLLERKRRMLAGADRRVARRADTAGKFKLGGLIVLAGLRDLPESVLLGGLIELRRRIGDSREAARLREIGAREFERRRSARSVSDR